MDFDYSILSLSRMSHRGEKLPQNLQWIFTSKRAVKVYCNGFAFKTVKEEEKKHPVAGQSFS